MRRIFRRISLRRGFQLLPDGGLFLLLGKGKFFPRLCQKQVRQAGMAVHDKVAVTVAAKSILVFTNGDGFGPRLVVIGDASVPIHLLDRIGENMENAVIPRSIISRSMAVLSLPPDRLTAWNCFCGSLRMVVPIGDSLCVSPHF